MGDNISTMGDNISTMGDNISTMGDNISTVEGIQYSGGIPSVQWGDNISTVGDNISTVEVAQYSGDKDLKYYEFSTGISKFFPELISLRNQIGHITGLKLLTTADMVKDLGYKNLGACWVKYSFEPMTTRLLEIFCEIFWQLWPNL